jgi:moderate conductance mechanosensitive channel
MELGKGKAPQKILPWHRWALASLVVAGTIVLQGPLLPGWSQTPQPTAKPTGLSLEGLEQRLIQRLAPPENSDTVAGAVSLDGYTLFTVTASTAEVLEKRVQSIEQRLEQLAGSEVNPQKLQVSLAQNSSNGLPVIFINGQYLMEVRPQDVDSGDLWQWAEGTAQTIRNALLRSQSERQPVFLARQGILTGGIVLLIVGGSLSASYWQRRLRAEQRALQDHFRSDQELLAVPTGPGTTAQDSAATRAAVEQQLWRQQKYNFKGIQQWILQVGKYGLWGGGSFIILGLFPYTRPLQPVILSALQAPLKILGIGLGTYLVIRVGFVAINRFFAVLGDQELLAPVTSQRLALRASTFSRVLQGAIAVSLSIVGVLASLAVIGVDLVPLLAGAGVIGLAISFASQSLIKDAINGFLILFEDQYGVGDVIAIGEVAGFVEYMNLRITQLRSAEGRLITIPNSEIKIVQNLSKDWSRVDLAVKVSYGMNPDQALAVIKQVAREIYRDRPWREKIPEPPEVLGIDELDHAGILIRVWIKTRPLEQWSVAREFRRRLKLAFDEQGIAIGVPQQSFHFQDSLTLQHQTTGQTGKATPAQDHHLDPSAQG